MKVKSVYATGICLALVFSCNYVLLIYFYKGWIPAPHTFANSTSMTKTITGTEKVYYISTTSLPSSNAQTTSPPSSPILRTISSFKVTESCKTNSLKGALRIDFKEAQERYEIESRFDTNRNETDGMFFGHYTVKHPSDNSSVFVGGENCIPKQTVAIIIPFRNRESHLKILLGHLLPILQRQGSRYATGIQLRDNVFCNA